MENLLCSEWRTFTLLEEQGPHQNKTPLFTDPSKKETCTLSPHLTPIPGAQPQCGPSPGAPMKPGQLAQLCSQPMDLPLRLTLAHSRRWGPAPSDVCQPAEARAPGPAAGHLPSVSCSQPSLGPLWENTHF